MDTSPNARSLIWTSRIVLAAIVLLTVTLFFLWLSDHQAVIDRAPGFR